MSLGPSDLLPTNTSARILILGCQDCSLLTSVLREHCLCAHHTNRVLKGTNSCCCSGEQARDSLSVNWSVTSARLGLLDLLSQLALLTLT